MSDTKDTSLAQKQVVELFESLHKQAASPQGLTKEFADEFSERSRLLAAKIREEEDGVDDSTSE